MRQLHRTSQLRALALTGTVVGVAQLAACGGPGPTPTPGPTVTAAPTQTSTLAPTQTPTNTQPGVRLTDGAWTTGNATLTVSGPSGGTWQSPLFAATSSTTAGKTTLRYTERDALIDATILIDSDGVSLTADTMIIRIIAGAQTADSPCTATFTSADATAVEGTVICPNAQAILKSGAPDRREVQISFSAAR